MYTTMKRQLILAVLAVVALASLSCSSELTDNAAPVELVLSTSQNLNQVDLQTGAGGCAVNVGTITMQVIPKSTTGTSTLTAVRVNRYRVSYRRVDGGTMVPPAFVRSIDTLIQAGETSGIGNLVVIEPDALSQAPFAALLPQNGNRDPETGRGFVKLEVIVEVFGETLGGDNVSDSTAFQIDFCYDCGGCH
jgi:alpha-D-ribose 1-methylphosphonate 5-triphosphate synthase subunit PhnG